MKWLLYYTKRFLLSGAALLLALAACEGVLRGFGYYYVPFAIHAGGTTQDWRFKHVYEDACFVSDPDLIWRPKPNAAVFNSQGFRGRELPPDKRPGELRVFAIGDSNTLGWDPEAPAEYHGANWPEYLESLLAEATQKQVTVVNAGVWGYSSFQGVALTKRVLDYRPDIVLVSYGSNDAQRVAVSDDHFHTAVFRSAWGNLRTVQLMKAVCDRIGGAIPLRPEDYVFRVPVEKYRSNLQGIIRMCREQGVRCILLTRPFIGESPGSWCWKTYAPDYVTATFAVGSEQEVPVVDVYRAFEDKPAMFADESHFTEEGHREAAKLICDTVLTVIDRKSDK
jgi:lysophospholipase L1-like esterase